MYSAIVKHKVNSYYDKNKKSYLHELYFCNTKLYPSLSHKLFGDALYSWGHFNSGASQLAYTILLHHTNDGTVAYEHYRAFLRNIVSKKFINKSWYMSSADVEQWLQNEAYLQQKYRFEAYA